MHSLKAHARITGAMPALAIVGLLLVPRAAGAQQHWMDGPIAPLGTARTIGMGSAVVALGLDAGGVALNPSAASNTDIDGSSSVTGATGARGPDFFAAHVTGQAPNQPPGAVWAAALTGSGGIDEQMLGYTASSSTMSGLDVGGTMRYERWDGPNGTQYHGDADLGARLTRRGNPVVVGVSVLNIFHPAIFSGQTYGGTEETQVVGGVGLKKANVGDAEVDYVYSDHHKFARYGAELQIAKGYMVRAGVSDRDYCAGASFNILGNDLQAAVVFPNHQRSLYMLGYTSRF